MSFQIYSHIFFAPVQISVVIFHRNVVRSMLCAIRDPKFPHFSAAWGKKEAADYVNAA